MNILWFTEFYPRDNKDFLVGGVQGRCHFVGNYLKSKHHLQVIEGVPEHFAKASSFSFLVRLLYLPLEVIKGLASDFDLIEASNFVMYAPAWIVARIKRKPLVFWYPDVFIGSWIKNVGPVGIIGEVMERVYLILGADHYIAISDSVRRKLITAGVEARKISVVYCGVDLAQISEITKLPVKKRCDLVAVSRLINYKHIDYLLQALAKINVTMPNLSLNIIGWGSQRKYLEKLAVKLDLEKQVQFLGKLNSHREVLKLISESKVFCHPSLVEGFGISLVEAAALGVPYIASNIPVITEVTNNGQGGLLFKDGSIDDLAEKIGRLLRNKSLYQEKSQEAKKMASQYSWQKLSQETLKVYEGLCSH